MAAVFIAHSTLQQWADAGKVRLDETTLHLLKEGRSVLLKPAVRFTKLTVGDEDPHALLGKVKTADQLREMGAEHYMDSVIHVDTAYEVVDGFMGDLQASKPTAAAVPAPVPEPVAEPSAEPSAAADGEDVSDAEALSKLFLDTVR